MFPCCQSKQSVERSLDWPLILDAMTAIWRRRNDTANDTAMVNLSPPRQMAAILQTTKFSLYSFYLNSNDTIS